MTLLDAYALIALIMGEPAMEKVSGILRGGRSAMTTTNIAEVFDISVRRHGLSRSRVVDVVEPLLEGPIRPIPVDVDIACRAAEIRGKHYHRTDCAISLADAILLAAASSNDRIATADPDVLTTATTLGIETIKLP